MLILWMAYGTLIGAAISAAALAAEQIVAIWGGARRVVWGIALATAVMAPVLVAIVSRESAPKTAVVRDVERVTIDGSVFGSPARAPDNRANVMRAQLTSIVLRLEGRAAQLWAGVSALLLFVFLRAGWMLRGRRAEWRATNLDGCEVLVARDVGPAVIGAWRPRIVFPEWALALDDNKRMLMMRHECEHVAARDPLLLLMGGLAIVCAPWNAALWFIVNRLRLAVEIDCDARVLRQINRPREYGMLLLAVGARHATPLRYAASLAERKPLLERRIRAMTKIRPSHPVLVSVVLGVVALATTTLVAQAPQPKALRLGRALFTREQTRTAKPIDVTPVPATAAKSDSAILKARPVDRVTPSSTVHSPKQPAAIDTAPASATDSPALQVAKSSTATASNEKSDVPFSTIRAWIARYHPDIVSGTSSAALITIIVDANDSYVSSTTDAVQPNPGGKIPVDSIAQIEVLKGAAAIATYGNAAANGVIVVTTKSGAGAAMLTSSDSANSKSRGIGYFIDGKRVDNAADLVRLRVNSNATPIARPLYVIDGVVVDSPDPLARPSDQLDKLGIPSDGIQSVQVLRARAGQIGPNALSIVIVKLKA